MNSIVIGLLALIAVGVGYLVYRVSGFMLILEEQQKMLTGLFSLVKREKH